MTMHPLDVFSPTGRAFEVHRDETKTIGSKFAGRLNGADPVGATVQVSFWSRPGRSAWTQLAAGTFASPDPSWVADDSIAICTVGPPAGGPASAGRYGVKFVVTTSDGQVHVADHPLTLLGAMS